MKRIALTLALVSVVGCKKKDDSTTPPVDPTTSTDPTGGDEAPTEPAEPEVPQEPDPEEIATGRHHYMVGHYQEAIDLLTPVYEDLKERQQYRASGLAGGWLALAHAQLVFENGQEPAEHALAMGERTKDPEVVAVAKLSHGAILTGQEDFDGARTALAESAKASPGTVPGALANILRAEALIGSAFGSGASDTVENPQDLEDAKAAYDSARKTAQKGVETDILMGRVEEGLAAIARYQQNKAGICEHAVAAVGHFKKAGASDYLVEGPQKLAGDFKCKLPKE